MKVYRFCIPENFTSKKLTPLGRFQMKLEFVNVDINLTYNVTYSKKE